MDLHDCEIPAPRKRGEVDAAEQLQGQAKRPPAKKDTKRWCGGKVGREHTIVTTLNEYQRLLSFTATHRPNPCRPRSVDDDQWLDGNGPWICRHNTECSTCGKVLKHYYELSSDDCPDYKESE